MKTYRTMRLAILVCQLGLILRSEAQAPLACITSDTNRAPENTDISVDCGTEYMQMSIYICPVYNALYNESLMALNGQFNKAECFGTPDFTVNPPVLKFKFSINVNALDVCGNRLEITNDVGTGIFSDFSNVQSVNISGVISSLDPSAGTITYRQQILYMFSCRYPMQYLVNNTELGVSGVSLAVRDNNGTFISTLSMHLYEDRDYVDPLIVPPTGLNLKTRIYVAVKATNLTDRFNVLLDRCYASTHPIPSNSTFYDLFVGCTRDGQTLMELNGDAQNAHFSFEAFRFVEHKNQTISTFYLHCVTRLCQVAQCEDLKPDCSSRRKRAVPTSQEEDNNSVATVSSPAISVSSQTNATESEKRYNRTLKGVIGSLGFLTALFVFIAVCLALYIRKRKIMQ
ncbi:zona pellucida-like domain-containing protein 1 [Centroberyx affinis]|uniref:zona pellucida-like domain-containing protein 1 n=1 Tax=Centroberyx affinis TaxID=166261 RepID=UPI003A5C4605